MIRKNKQLTLQLFKYYYEKKKKINNNGKCLQYLARRFSNAARLLGGVIFTAQMVSHNIVRCLYHYNIIILFTIVNDDITKKIIVIRFSICLLSYMHQHLLLTKVNFHFIYI
jgi:hypothetical protein